MKKYICTVCEYIYDPEQGDPEAELNQELLLKTFQMIGLVLYAESGKKISSRTKDKTKGENLLRGNGRCVKMRTFFFLSTKPRLSQAGALLLPKDFVSLGIRFSL